METKIYDIREGVEGYEGQIAEAMDAASSVIKSGGVVAFPTETVYGLGADALNPNGVASIFEAKGRPSDNPLIVHIASLKDLEGLCESIPENARKLADVFWPGPLTMVLFKSKEVPYITTGGLSTVAVRMPRHSAALQLIRQSGRPIAAPSANISGKPSPTKAEHVINDLYGKIPVILDGGDCTVGIESTVIDMTGDIPFILRPGFVTAEDISQVLGFDVEIKVHNDTGSPKSPGIKYRHYSPKAEIIIFDGKREEVEAEIAKRKSEEEALGRSVGVILFGETDYEEAAHNFFARLREMDDLNVDIILTGAVNDSHGKGIAIMDRMFKSAGIEKSKHLGNDTSLE